MKEKCLARELEDISFATADIITTCGAADLNLIWFSKTDAGACNY